MRSSRPWFFSGGFFGRWVVAREGLFSKNFSEKFAVACKLLIALFARF